MSRERIAIDIDEVLFPFLDGFIQHHDARYKTALLRNHFNTYQFSVPLRVSIPESVERVHTFLKALDSDAVEPINGSKEAIAKLAGSFTLCVVTARHPQFEETTISWLGTHYPDYFDSVNLLGMPITMEREPRSKIEVCAELGAIALIDDQLHHVNQCAAANMQGVLFGNYPWNQAGELPSGVTRCQDWSEVLDYFNVS